MCEICKTVVFRNERSDAKYRFCSKKCAGKAGVRLASQVDKSGSKNPAWRGGVQIFCGYRMISIGKKKRQFEHRMKMEKKLGRTLLKNEIVHHKNGDKLDNRLSNLKIMTQSEHIKEHMKNGEMKLDYWRGKERTDETKRKMSESAKRRWDNKKICQ